MVEIAVNGERKVVAVQGAVHFLLATLILALGINPANAQFALYGSAPYTSGVPTYHGFGTYYGMPGYGSVSISGNVSQHGLLPVYTWADQVTVNPYLVTPHVGNPYSVTPYAATPYSVTPHIGNPHMMIPPTESVRILRQLEALVEPSRPATILVRVPSATAQVWFQGTATRQQGLERQFASPPLEPGYKYTYEVRGRWQHNGENVERTRKVKVGPGAQVVVDFTKGS